MAQGRARLYYIHTWLSYLDMLLLRPCREHKVGSRSWGYSRPAASWNQRSSRRSVTDPFSRHEGVLNILLRQMTTMCDAWWLHCPEEVYSARSRLFGRHPRPSSWICWDLNGFCLQGSTACLRKLNGSLKVGCCAQWSRGFSLGQRKPDGTETAQASSFCSKLWIRDSCFL